MDVFEVRTALKILELDRVKHKLELGRVRVLVHVRRGGDETAFEPHESGLEPLVIRGPASPTPDLFFGRHRCRWNVKC